MADSLENILYLFYLTVIYPQWKLIVFNIYVIGRWIIWTFCVLNFNNCLPLMSEIFLDLFAKKSANPTWFISILVLLVSLTIKLQRTTFFAWRTKDILCFWLEIQWIYIMSVKEKFQIKQWKLIKMGSNCYISSNHSQMDRGIISECS